MAGIDVGSGGGRRRSINAEVNMIPFIDLLMCTIAFLLITAVWTTSARVATSADVPGQPGAEVPPDERALHVSVKENDFVLEWKAGRSVLSQTTVPRQGVDIGQGEHVTRYPELARAIEKDWRQYREHFDAADHHTDRLVLHSDDRTPFRDLVAVLDAANATRREMRSHDGKLVSVPAFSSTFAIK